MEVLVSKKSKSVRVVKSLTDKQIKSLKLIPDSQKGMFERAYTNKGRASLLIKTKCLECCCNSRDEVTNCSDSSCPLWTRRPFQK
jgi:hypothetical protein